MHKSFAGEILQGNWNDALQELTVLSVKNVPTQSVWDMNQMDAMYNQTARALETDQEGMVITVRDSIPLILNRQEVLQLKQEMEAIKSSLMGNSWQ